MPRKMPEEFEGREIYPLCVTTRLDDAKRIESSLDKAGIDYTFEITPVTGGSIMGILFGSNKDGVMFLVLSEQLDFCRELLIKEGLSENIIE